MRRSLWPYPCCDLMIIRDEDNRVMTRESNYGDRFMNTEMFPNYKLILNVFTVSGTIHYVHLLCPGHYFNT